MKRILFYTQAMMLGGSIRLLLNIAEALARDCHVSFAMHRGPVGTPAEHEAACRLVRDTPGIVPVPLEQALDNRMAPFDVLVGHFPFWIDIVAHLQAVRKIALSTELTDIFPVPLNETNLGLFHAMAHTHEEHVSHLVPEVRRRFCRQIPIVNDVNYVPCYRRTRAVACVGSWEKHDPAVIAEVLRRTGRLRAMKLYTSRPFGESLQTLPRRDARWLRWQRCLGRLRCPGPVLNTRALMNSFDCLLHMPSTGNATSMVISNALACGKLVVLRDLPCYQTVYGGLAGVHFLSQTGLDLSTLLDGYDRSCFDRIANGYGLVYDRPAALEEWRSLVLES